MKNKTVEKPKKIGFVVYQEAVWKSDKIVEIINNSSNSSATIIIMPIYNKNKLIQKDWMQSVKFFTKKYMKIEKCENPNSLWQIFKIFRKYDIIVFSDCWNLSNSRWFELILLFKDCRYIPYSHQVSNYANYQAQYNQLFHNLVSKIYLTNEFESDIFEVYSNIKNDNTIFLGYPGVTKFIAVSDNSKNKSKIFQNDPWAKLRKNNKRIIWAPHHSILWKERKYSNFLEMSDYMLRLVDKYKDSVNFAFKPHPMLLEELKKVWDEKKVKQYYDFWTQNDNTLLSEGEYGDLFAYSDALIHDCGSFIAEYSYLYKPHAFILSSDSIVENFNDFGKKCMNTTSVIKNISEIDNFIELVASDALTERVKSNTFIKKISTISRSCETKIIKDFGVNITINRSKLC